MRTNSFHFPYTPLGTIVFNDKTFELFIIFFIHNDNKINCKIHSLAYLSGSFDKTAAYMHLDKIVTVALVYT